MPNIVPTARYYPKLSEVVTVDDLPEFLSFVQNGLNSIFDKIHYKNLQYSKSRNGDSAFYSLEIVSKKLSIPLPFDMELQLNPDLTGSNDAISSFPITLEYQWEILAFLKSFDLNGFSFSLEDFYSVGLNVFRITEDQVLAHILNYFVEPIDSQTTKFEQFVSDFNSIYPNANLVLPAAPSVSTVVEAVNELSIQDKNLSLLLFGIYILDTDLNVTKSKLQQFYGVMVPEGIEAYIKKIITPKAKATLALRAGIVFPEKILRPVQPDGIVIPNKKTMFVFAEAQLYVDTEAGIGYQLELGGSLYPINSFAEIGKTGILLQIDTLKLDLSKTTNIPEADADGRPNDFIGVYARAISVTLPSKWFHDGAVQGTATTTLRLGGYDLLIGTGGVSGTIALETVPSVITTSAYYFEDKFDINFPIKVLHKNAATNSIETIEVADLAMLKTYLYPSDGSIPPCPIKFPITIKEKPLSTGVVKTFSSLTSYQQYLNSFPNDNTTGDTTPTLWKKIGSENGFNVGFNKFDLTFKQNKVVYSNIKGALEIKKFVHPDTGEQIMIDVEGHLEDNGNFELKAALVPSYPIVFPEVFTYNLKTIELRKEENGDDDLFYVGTSGTLQFVGFLKDTLNIGSIEIERLRIYSDGSIEFTGGSVQLIEPIVLPLGPVNITVSAIHYGSHQKEVNGKMRKFNYFGFDGGISIDPLGIEVRGDGVKYYYCVDDIEGHPKPKPYLHIQTLYLDLTIPADSGSIAQINGWVNIPEPGISKEYAGDVTLQLPKAKLVGKAAMKLMPKYPAFIIDCELEPTVPIPLGSFAIYGFRGLLGYRYVAEKEAINMTSENTWYEYYKAPKRGININKFSGPDRSVNYNTLVSLGAGATLGTSADNGYTFSMKAMALFSIPSLFMIDGRANIISARLGLDDTKDPPFFAFVAVGDDSLELGFGADYKLPENGSILSVYADVQAGFFFKNQRPWYVNIGTNVNPVKSRIITLLDIQSFVMLSAKGIEAGARGEFNFDRNYGVISVKANAYIEIGGKISFERPQMGAYLQAGVSAQIKVLFVSLGLEVGILFGVEAPKPFLIYGKFYFKIKVGIKVFGKRITLFKFSGDLEVVWNYNKNVDRSPVNPLIVGIKNPLLLTEPEKAVLGELVQGVNMLTNEPFSLTYLNSRPDLAPVVNNRKPENFESGTILNYIIPLDTYIDIKTQKGLLPGNGQDPNNSVRKLIGGINNAPKDYEDLIPPVSTIRGRSIRQVKHQYTIDHLVIKFWNKSRNRWDDYHPYEALYPLDTAVRNLKVGHFQKVDGKYNALRILATTPFSYTEQGQPGWFVPEQYGLNSSTLFCEAKHRELKCTDISLKPLHAKYYCGNSNTPFFSNNVSFQLITNNQDDYAFISNEPNFFNQTNSLAFNNWNGMEILLPAPTVMTRLKISNFSNGVKVKFYSIIQSPVNDVLFNVIYGNPNPNASDVDLPYEMQFSGEALQQDILYNFIISNDGKWDIIHPNWRPISKIVIEPLFDSSISQQISMLSEQISVIENDNNLISLGLMDGELLSTDILEEQLHQLICSSAASTTFINRYQKVDSFNYCYSKEFNEGSTSFIYSLGTTENKGLISKVAIDGNLIWERKYEVQGESDRLIVNRIIKLDTTDDDCYIAYASTDRKHYLLRFNSGDGTVVWFKQIEDADHRVNVQIAPLKSDSSFYIAKSDRNGTGDIPVVSIADSDGVLVKASNLYAGSGKLSFTTITEDEDGILIVGNSIEGALEESFGIIIKLDTNLNVVKYYKILDRSTIIHDLKIVDGSQYLISGYDKSREEVFFSLLTDEGSYQSYNIIGSRSHNSHLQLGTEGFYLLVNTDLQGTLYNIDWNFDIKWAKEIDLENGSNGIQNFTFNLETNKLTLNCFNEVDCSLLVHTDKDLNSCLTKALNFSSPSLDELSIDQFELTDEEHVIQLTEIMSDTESFTSDIKRYCIDLQCGKEDVKVCNLYYEILEIYETCLIDPNVILADDFVTVSSCYNQVLTLLRVFDPNYQLSIYLSNEQALITQFISMKDLQSYNLAWNAVQLTLSYLDRIGNCLCKCISKDITLIHQVCWMSVQDYDYNINIPSLAAIAADSQATIKGVTQYIQPIWRPDTSYFVHFRLKDSVDNGTLVKPFEFTYGFTTAGPVGYFHTHEKATYGDLKLKIGDRLLKEDNSYYIVASNGLLDENAILAVANSNGFIYEDTTGLLRDSVTKALIIEPGSNPARDLKVVAHPDKYHLTTLKQYIDYNRSYPNADGNLLSAKPLFYNDETTQIYLFFNKAYATHFFHKWNNYKNPSGINNAIDGRLKIIIKDPIEGVEIVNPPSLDVVESITTIPQTEEVWSVDEDPQLPFVISQYLNLYEDSTCTGTLTTIKPKSEYVTVTPKFLKPNKLYTAIVNNMYDINHNGEVANTLDETREVHKFLFKTSRYATFKEQVDSYNLKQTIEGILVQREALFHQEKQFSQEVIDAAYDTILGQPLTGFSTNALSALENNYQHPYDRIVEGIFELPPMDEAISTEVNVIRNLLDNKIIAIVIRNPEPFNNPRMPLQDVQDTLQVLSGSIVDASYKILFSKDYSQAVIMHSSKEISTHILSMQFKYKMWNGLSYAVPNENSNPETSDLYTIKLEVII